MLFLLYALVCVILIAIFWIGATWLQNLMYSEPTTGLPWRAPAAAAVVTLALGLWGWLDYRDPESVPGLFQFKLTKTNHDPFKELWTDAAGKEAHYTMRTTVQGPRVKHEFVEDESKRPWPPKPLPDAIIIQENGEKARFENRKPTDPKLPSEFVDSRGRVITDIDPSRYELFSWGLMWKNLFVYTALLIGCFLAFWLLLRFQWHHALGMAFVFWLTCVLVLVPPMLEQVEKKAAEKASASAAP